MEKLPLSQVWCSEEGVLGRWLISSGVLGLWLASSGAAGFWVGRGVVGL